LRRIDQIGDPGSVQLVDIAHAVCDPLGFDDGVPYPERLRGAQSRTGIAEAILVARARVDGAPVIVTAMEFEFLGGSLGASAGEAFASGCELAVAEGRGLISVCASGGARMQEGIVSLAQMARCTVGMDAVASAGLPSISVITDPCFGGVAASFTTQADVILAEPQARIGFAGRRVIEQATHEQLPDGFQSAEFLLAHGMIDAVVPRGDLRRVISRLLAAYGTRIGGKGR